MPLPSTVRKPVTVAIGSALSVLTSSEGIRSRTRVMRTREPTVIVAPWAMAGATEKWRNPNSEPWLPSESSPVLTSPMGAW